MEFKKYQHLERLGTTSVQGITEGMCYIFPKLDGSNAQIWMDKHGNLKAGSRNRMLDLHDDHAGFYQWVLKNEGKFIPFFMSYPTVRLHGEWLVKHTLGIYRDDAWRKFYVFDVSQELEDGTVLYQNYEAYKDILDIYKIEYIPAICKIKDPSPEKLMEQLKKNTYLIKDGEGTGEGIVIKNYHFVNRYGRVTWAKIVENRFKTQHRKTETPELKEKALVEKKIVDKFVTNELVRKEHAKIVTKMNGWESKYIPQLLGIVYHCLITEECWNFVKDFKNPIIDFKMLQLHCNKRIREAMPELF